MQNDKVVGRMRKKKHLVAYRVTSLDSTFSFIIFASTKHKAKKIFGKLYPLGCCKATREPCADEYCVWIEGGPKDRQILFNHFNYGCLYISEYCEDCTVRDRCCTWKGDQK